MDRIADLIDAEELEELHANRVEKKSRKSQRVEKNPRAREQAL